MLTIISAVTANSFNHFSVVFTLITNADLENPEGQECPNLPDPSDMPDLEEQAISSDGEDKEPSSTCNPVTRKSIKLEDPTPQLPLPPSLLKLVTRELPQLPLFPLLLQMLITDLLFRHNLSHIF